MNRKGIEAWVEAVRLRTLPVSVAGVLAAWALGIHMGVVKWIPALICLVFALLCQVASNFANEYYDYRDGMDRPGRSGPRRGVTEGDISARSMKTAAFAVLLIACLLGLWLMYWGGPWLIAVGVAVALGAMAYSAGPYPLSRHGLGEVAVVFFFGIVPVNFTFYLSTGEWNWRVSAYSLSIGLMASNVLIVNNYRDADEDKTVGKMTLANLWGRQQARRLYLFSGIAAFVLSVLASTGYNMLWVASVIYIPLHLFLWYRMELKPGEPASRLNPYLGATAMAMLIFAVFLFI